MNPPIQEPERDPAGGDARREARNAPRAATSETSPYRPRSAARQDPPRSSRVAVHEGNDASAGVTRAPTRLGRGDASDRPRERLRTLGARSLSDAELIALLVRTGGRGRDVLEVARALLEHCGGLPELARVSERRLADVAGVGPAKAASLQAALEIGRRVAGSRTPIGTVVRGPEDVQRYFHPRLRDAPHEVFAALLLDSRHRIVKEVVVSQGTLTASLVHPREVFRAAVHEAAAALVLVHNHPSGDPSPSAEDRTVTERLAEAGTLMGIRVLDHVVVAEHGYYSFSEAGELGGAPRGGR